MESHTGHDTVLLDDPTREGVFDRGISSVWSSPDPPTVPYGTQTTGGPEQRPEDTGVTIALSS